MSYCQMHPTKLLNGIKGFYRVKHNKYFVRNVHEYKDHGSGLQVVKLSDFVTGRPEVQIATTFQSTPLLCVRALKRN